MAAPVVDLSVDKGRSYRMTFNFLDDSGNPMNLAPFYFVSQMRVTEAVDSDLLCTPTIDSSHASSGAITLQLYDTDTDNLESSTGYYDLVATAGQTVQTLVGGQVAFNDRPTQHP